MAKDETYEQFVEKFKRPLTTDDCYTPEPIYNVIAQRVQHLYHVDPSTFCRPFYPGGDYEHYDYTGKIVVDNPPFSIEAKIVDFYNKNNIKFFLFTNGLTVAYYANRGCGMVIIKSSIVYENGAKPKTAFITNLDNRIIIDGVLSERLRIMQLKPKKQKYILPSNVKTSAELIKMCKPNEVMIFDRYEPYTERKLYGGAIRLPADRENQ